MKTILIIILFNIICLSQTLFRISDKQGNIILETNDSILVSKFKNVKIDTLNDTINLINLKSNVVDDLKNIIIDQLGKPQIEEYNYHLEWFNDSIGKIILNKPVKSQPVLICNRKGMSYIKKTIIGILPDPVIIKYQNFWSIKQQSN